MGSTYELRVEGQRGRGGEGGRKGGRGVIQGWGMSKVVGQAGCKEKLEGQRVVAPPDLHPCCQDDQPRNANLFTANLRVVGPRNIAFATAATTVTATLPNTHNFNTKPNPDPN